MADTRVQLEAEDWVRREWMPEVFGAVFSRERLRLAPGGQFDFDAVSLDRKVAAVISTNGGRTASGRPALPKLHKIRSDVLFLLMAPLIRRLVVLTDRDMYDLCLAEKSAGRMPADVEFYHVTVPAELEARLRSARKRAAEEVTPER